MPYRIIPVHIGRGDQFQPDFLKIAPNNRIPAITDHNPADHNQPISIFESGAILWYLAEKTGQFLPQSTPEKTDVMQWLMWQMGGLGPMLGQNHHFRSYAPEPVPYAIERYEKETQRLYSVLNNQLANRDYICNQYSIADMACYPWTVPHERQGINLDIFPNVKQWFDRIKQRPAVIRAYQKAEEVNSQPTMDEQAKKIMFGQTKPAIPE